MKKGTLKSVNGQTLELEDDAGNLSSHEVATDATITLNKMTAKLTDLTAGDHVELTGNPAKTVTALRP